MSKTDYLFDCDAPLHHYPSYRYYPMPQTICSSPSNHPRSIPAPPPGYFMPFHQPCSTPVPLPEQYCPKHLLCDHCNVSGEVKKHVHFMKDKNAHGSSTSQKANGGDSNEGVDYNGHKHDSGDEICPRIHAYMTFMQPVCIYPHPPRWQVPSHHAPLTRASSPAIKEQNSTRKQESQRKSSSPSRGPIFRYVPPGKPAPIEDDTHRNWYGRTRGQVLEDNAIMANDRRKIDQISPKGAKANDIFFVVHDDGNGSWHDYQEIVEELGPGHWANDLPGGELYFIRHSA